MNADKRFVILGTEGSYIVKDLTSRKFVSIDIPTMEAAMEIRNIFVGHLKREGEAKNEN